MRQRTTSGSARGAGFALAAFGVALLLVLVFGRIVGDGAVAFPAQETQTDNLGPALFLPAPNPEPLCAGQDYFGPWTLNEQYAGPNSANRATVDTDFAYTSDVPGEGVVATFTSTAKSAPDSTFGESPTVFGGAGSSIGIIMFEPAAATVTLSEPLFYSQWIFTDQDRPNEGFEVRPSWVSPTGGELGIYGSLTTWEFGASDSNLADFNTTDERQVDGFDLSARAQVDFWAPIDGFSVLRTGGGGSGFAGGGGCIPMGVAKSASEPVWDAASGTFSVDYVVAVNNNLPSTATLQAAIDAAQAANGKSFQSGDPLGIDIVNLVVNDPLQLDGFSDASVSSVTSDVFTVNPSYDGVNDTALFAGTDSLAAESTGSVNFTVTYTPDFTDTVWNTCTNSIENQATATAQAGGIAIDDVSDAGTDPSPVAVNGDEGTDDPTPVTFTLDCGISLAKDVTAGPVNNGDGSYDIEYTLVATNSGTAPLTDVVIDDDLAATFGSALTSSTLASDTCEGVTLNAGDSCTKVFDLTVNPTSAFEWVNTGTVTAVGPGGVTVTANDDAQTGVTEEPAVTLTKVATAGPVSNGDGSYTVEYTLTAQNSGSTVLNDVAITDDLSTVFGGTLQSSAIVSDSCTRASLNASVPPGNGDTCSQVLTVVFVPGAELGPYDNSAVVTAVSPGGTEVTATSNESVTAPGQNPAIDLVKTASTGELAVGVVVGYDFLVTNTGDVVLNNVALTDDLLTDVSCPTSTLAVGESTTCTGTYTITQADVDAGNVQNTASVTGISPDGQQVTDTDSVDYPLDQNPDISLVKDSAVVDTNADGLTNAGDLIEYTLTLTNTGNVTLTEVVLDDPLIDNETCPATTLAPGESMVCTGTYTITAADVAAGSVINEATVATLEKVTDKDKETTETEESPAINLVKTASPGELAAGELVEYALFATNIGDVPLTNVVVTDDLLTDVTCPSTQLAPGESMICAGTYTINQADVDAGNVPNTATVTGVSPAGETVTDTDSVSYPIGQLADIALVKDSSVVDVNEDGLTNAGDLIEYTMTVINVGNVTLTAVVLDDPLLNDESCPKDVLTPGESMQCTGTWEITPLDVVAGKVTNTATATSTEAGPVEDTETTPTQESPAIDLVKSASPGDLAVGVVVDYSFDVTNTGDVSLGNVELVDDLLSDVSCPKTSLAVQESMICSGTYTITQADVDRGGVNNTATVTGVSPAGQAVSDTDSVDYPLGQSPIFVVDKHDAVGEVAVGNTIAYPITLTNLGDVTLTSVMVVDSLSDDVRCGDFDVLAPGESLSCVAEYVVTQADVDACQIVNVANGAAADPDGATLSDSDSVTTRTNCVPNISVTKKAIDVTLVNVGDTVQYEIVVTNTGTTTLHDVVIDDPLTSDETCPTDVLAPGESMTCTASYVVTQRDMDAGRVDNVVTATGVDPTGQTVSDDDDETVPSNRDPELVLDKKQPSGTAAPGSTLTYPLVVTNTGTVTVSEIVVTDSLSAEVVCDVDVLAPGEVAYCTATYVVSANDEMAGQITNTATVNGVDPTGRILTDQDTEVVIVPKKPKPTPVPPVKPTPVPPVKPTPVPPVKPTPVPPVKPTPVPPVKPTAVPPVKPKPPLAYTGAQPVPVALSAIGMVLLGVTLVAGNPRRKDEQ